MDADLVYCPLWNIGFLLPPTGSGIFWSRPVTGIDLLARVVENGCRSCVLSALEHRFLIASEVLDVV